jgi:hypothetical protein
VVAQDGAQIYYHRNGTPIDMEEIPKGTELKIESTSDDRCFLTYKGKPAYVRRQLLATKQEFFEAEQTAKGLVQYQGEWITTEQRDQKLKQVFEAEQKAKGLVQYEGQWITTNEVAQAKQREAVARQREAKAEEQHRQEQAKAEELRRQQQTKEEERQRQEADETRQKQEREEAARRAQEIERYRVQVESRKTLEQKARTGMVTVREMAEVLNDKPMEEVKRILGPPSATSNNNIDWTYYKGIWNPTSEREDILRIHFSNDYAGGGTVWWFETGWDKRIIPRDELSR